MCDPVPSLPVLPSCGFCGLCEYCEQVSRDSLTKQAQLKDARQQAPDDEPVRVFVSPAALTPTGATPSNPAVDPGLLSDRWSLHQQQFGGPHAGNLKKIGQPLDPKDLRIDLTYNSTSRTVRVKLSHKPTGLSVEETGPDTVKEAIHSRLYGHLKGMVEKLQADAGRLEQVLHSSIVDDETGLALRQYAHCAPVTEDEALVMEAYDFGQFSKDMLGPVLTGGYARGMAEPVRVALCNVLDKMHDRLYGKSMAIAAEARTVPEPQLVDYKPWYDAVTDACIVSGELPWDEKDARGSLARLIAWREEVALDPKVSERAAALAEQPSSQVHPDSGMPSKKQEGEKELRLMRLDTLRKQLLRTPIHHSETRFDLAMQIDRLEQEVKK